MRGRGAVEQWSRIQVAAVKDCEAWVRMLFGMRDECGLLLGEFSAGRRSWGRKGMVEAELESQTAITSMDAGCDFRAEKLQKWMKTLGLSSRI